jgi:hypothetical protein
MSEQFIHDGSGPDVDPATGDEAETKGPDPEVWGDPSTRPSPEPAGQEIVLGEDGEPIEVKGPDPAVWG